MLKLLLVLTTLLLAPAAAGEIHSWRDKDGNLHFSDSAPSQGTARETKVIQLQSGNNYTDNTPQVASQPSALLMYSTSWCGYCKKARNYFNANGIAFRELDVERNPSAERAYKRLGVSGVPVIIQDGRQMRGFSVASFQAFYREPVVTTN